MTALHPDRPTTRSATPLLTAGALAGPLYVGSGVLQAVLRPGFDIRVHPISVLSNGELGWLQITTFLLAGALTVAGAAGVRRALPDGAGAIWGPRLLALYGLGLVGAGVFRADPQPGFPPGTTTATVSWHGLLHLAVGAVGFLGFVGTCLVLARRQARQGRRGRALWSRATGVVFLAAFVGIAAGGGNPVLNLAFTAAVLLGWAWLTTTLLDLR
jgi:hypothetical membrane protein